MSLSDCFIVSADVRKRRVETKCSLGHESHYWARELFEYFYLRSHLFDGYRVPPPHRWVGMPCPCPVCECIEKLLPAASPFEEGVTLDWHIQNVMLKKGIYGSPV
jgi:hypothetical protein